MKKIKLIKRVSCLTALTLMFSSLAPASGLANALGKNKKLELNDISALESTNDIQEFVLNSELDEIITDIDLNDEVLSDDFDLEEAVTNMPSIGEMSSEEKELFDKIVAEQVSLAGLENEEEKELFAQAMTDFFDETSDTYNDLSSATDQLEEEIYDLEDTTVDESVASSKFKDVFEDNFGVKKAHAAVQVKIGVKLAGAIINGLIGFAVGGGVGAIQSFIIKKGKKEAQKIFTKTVVSQVKAWGAPKLALTVGACVTVALNYLDIGTQIAKLLDNNDKRPKSGYIDFY